VDKSQLINFKAEQHYIEGIEKEEEVTLTSAGLGAKTFERTAPIEARMAIEKRIMAILGRDWRLKWKVLHCAWRDLQPICMALQSNCMVDELIMLEGEVGFDTK
jgi:hypothetical protein